MADEIKDAPELQGVVPFGDLLTTIGVSLPQTQHQIEQAALRLLLQAQDATCAIPGQAEAGAVLAGSGHFYTIPGVKVELHVGLQYSSRRGGGLLNCILGGRTTTEQRQTESTITAELVQVPAPERIEELIRQAVAEVQSMLRDFFAWRAETTPVPNLPVPDGTWSDTWRALLSQFQVWWNEESEEKKDRSSIPVGGGRDEATLSALQAWHERYFPERLTPVRAAARGYLYAIRNDDLQDYLRRRKLHEHFDEPNVYKEWTAAFDIFRDLWNAAREPKLAKGRPLDFPTYRALLTYLGY